MVRTRFAPSPTGFLHIGGVRTALFNWLYARQHGGQFILRIDDTDKSRNLDEALPPILSGFKWLGLNWDEGPEVGGPYGPYFQSQREEHYQLAVAQLLESGHAYRCYSTPEEDEAERETAKNEKRGFRPRQWAAGSPDQAEQYEAEGRKGVVRLKMPDEGNCEFTDHIRENVQFPWHLESDHVIQRADGSFIYHLANVVDDESFKISHVIRAEEHLSNTPRQVFIAQSLGYNIPEYAHIPFVAEPGGSGRKLSKRKIRDYLKNPEFKKLYQEGEAIAQRIGKDVSEETTADSFNPVLVEFYETVGYLPDAILNYLVLLGWSLDDQTEDFSQEDMIKHFSLERVVKARASFDPAKLSAFQARRMSELPTKQFVAKCVPFLEAAGMLTTPPPCETAPLLTQILEKGEAFKRIKVAGDITSYNEFFSCDDDLVFETKAVNKHLNKEGVRMLLEEYRDMLTEVELFDDESLQAQLKSFCETKELKMRKMAQVVRVAVTGKEVGISTFATMEILGKASCLARIDRALTEIEEGEQV